MATIVHEWSTFVDDTQTGWDQTLAPVVKEAIALLLLQRLLPEKATVKLAAGQYVQIGDEGASVLPLISKLAVQHNQYE